MPIGLRMARFLLHSEAMKLSSKVVAAGLLAGACLVGCVKPWTSGDMARDRAAADFGCSKDQLVAEKTAEGQTEAFMVTGCGKSAEYTCKDRSTYQSRMNGGEGVQHELVCQQTSH